MKTLKAILLLFAAMAIVTACDPMEDESLRDKYITMPETLSARKN